MFLLKEDASVLVLALESYLDGLVKEITERPLGGRGAEIIDEYQERAARLILRLRQALAALDNSGGAK